MSHLALRYVQVAALIAPVGASAQIPAEGMGDFDAVVDQVLRHHREQGTQIILDLHWGSDIDQNPSYHDRFNVLFPTDTMAIVVEDKESLDTLVFLNDAWISAFLVDWGHPVKRVVTDSAGTMTIRETRERPDGGVQKLEERRWPVVGGEVCYSRWTGFDGNVSIDSTLLKDNGMRTTFHFWIENGHRVQTASSRILTAEVIKGMHLPVHAEYESYCSLWTYTLDRRGRIGRVDHYAFDLARGEMAEHDHLKIRYKR